MMRPRGCVNIPFEATNEKFTLGSTYISRNHRLHTNCFDIERSRTTISSVAALSFRTSTKAASNLCVMQAAARNLITMSDNSIHALSRRGVLAAALGSALLAVSGTPLTAFAASDPVDALARIKAKGEIRIGTEGVFVPYSYHDEKGVLTGYDVELARAVAAKLGVQPVFVESSWDSLLAGVDAGRFDIVVNQVEANEARRQKYDFSVPYMYDHTAILVRKDNDSIKTFEDLKGKRAAESATANSSRIAEAYGARIVGVQDFAQAVELVVSRRADTALNSELSIADFMRKKPDAPVQVVARYEKAEEMCVLITKGSTSLRTAIDQAIEALRADGTLEKLSEQSLGRDFTTK